MVARKASMRKGRMQRRRRTGTATRKMRIPRSVNTLATKRIVYQGSWQFSTASTTGFWRYLTVTANNATPNFVEVQALFDEYKINAVKWTFRPRYDTTTVTDASTGSSPQAYAHFVIDPASTVTPTGVYGAANLNTFLEQSGVQTRTLNKPFSIYLRPKIADSLSGGTSASRAIAPSFIKTSNAGVEHTGVHMFIQQNNMANTNANIILDQFVTVYMQYRNLK